MNPNDCRKVSVSKIINLVKTQFKYRDDGGVMFLRDVDISVADYTVSTQKTAI